MAPKWTRLNCRVHDDHPLYHLVEGNPRGGKIILDYATAWYGYLVGKQQHDDRPSENHGDSGGCSEHDDVPDELLNDALS